MDLFPTLLLPPEARSAAWASTAPPPGLLPGEAHAVARAVPRRRLEFARGRAAARAALGALGHHPAAAIAVGPHREPVWPPGVVGSISHCESLACAAVAPADRIEAIGIDVEPARTLPPEVRRRVLTEFEAESLSAATGFDTVGFGAKECIHKAVHPRTGAWLDFLDVRLEPVPGEGGVIAVACAGSVPDSARRLVDRLEVRWAIRGGLVFTAAWAHTDPAPAGGLRESG